MATERLAPDAILEQTNLSGAISSINDDPDSGGTLWMTAVTHGSDTSVRVSFPTPTPVLGGAQEIRASVRKTSEATAPSCALELWQSGVLITTVYTGTISTQQVVSGTFDAGLISDPSGIEVRVAGTAGGGNPSKRASLEVGAVEINTQYTAQVPSFSGSVSISGGGVPVATGTKATSGSVLLSGGGLSSASGYTSRNGAVLLSGGGTVTSVGSTAVAISGSVLISGGGTVLASGRKAASCGAAVPGGGAVASTARKGAAATVSIAGGGSGSSLGIAARFGSVSISGGGRATAFSQGILKVIFGRSLLMGVGR